MTGRLSRRAFLATAGAGALRGQDATPPNIVFILADDLGMGDLGCYGQKQLATPNIDSLAKDGLRFTQAYAGATVCAPSRCALATGRHGGHGRIRDNLPPGVNLMPEDQTSYELLKKAGYRTGLFGKWGLGDSGSWGMPHKKGIDEFFGYLNHDHAHFYYPQTLWENDREVNIPGNRANARASYAPLLVADRAERFIREQRSSPFFLSFHPTLVHSSDFPLQTPQALDIQIDSAYAERAWPEVEKRYASMVKLLDDQVGRLLGALKAAGAAGNTLVLFSSDNGPSAENLHRPDFFGSVASLRGTKRQLYEGGIRTPLLARWPGRIAPGTESRQPCAFWDLPATFAEIAGLPPAAVNSDGVSLAPFLRGAKPALQERSLYWEYGHARKAFSQAARIGDWKAVRPSRQSPVELYHLPSDPSEATDRAAGEAERAKTFLRYFDSARSESPDYPIAEKSSV